MSNTVGISPSVMINRLAHESGAPEAASLAEVAKLRGKLAIAQADELATAEKPDPADRTVVNGAEVDFYI